MKELGKIIFYLIATVILGSLLAAPLYWGGQWLASHGVLAFLGDVEFRRFFHRGLLVAAVVLLWPTARWLQVPNVRGLGLERNPRRWEHVAVGFVAAVALMAIYGWILVNLGVYKMRGTIRWEAFGQIALSAATVSLLEEWLFRGAILGLLCRGLAKMPALFFTSALFSILHFLKPEDSIPYAGPVTWLSGFEMLPGSFARFVQPLEVLGGFTTLFCVAWVLGWTVFQTRGLALAIGLHAGWVVGIKGFSKMTRRVNKETLPWLGDDLSIGLCSVAVVLLTGVVVWWWLSIRKGKVDDEPAPAHSSLP